MKDIQRVKRAVETVEKNILPGRGSMASIFAASDQWALFKTTQTISDANTSGRTAKIFNDGNLGQELTIYPFGLGGTVANNTEILCCRINGKWLAVIPKTCPT